MRHLATARAVAAVPVCGPLPRVWECNGMWSILYGALADTRRLTGDLLSLPQTLKLFRSSPSTRGVWWWG